MVILGWRRVEIHGLRRVQSGGGGRRNAQSSKTYCPHIVHHSLAEPSLARSYALQHHSTTAHCAMAVLQLLV